NFSVFFLFFTGIFKYMNKLYKVLFPQFKRFIYHNELKVKLISETLNYRNVLELMCTKIELIEIIDLTELINYFNNDNELLQVIKLERKVFKGKEIIEESRSIDMTTVLLWD